MRVGVGGPGVFPGGFASERLVCCVCRTERECGMVVPTGCVLCCVCETEKKCGMVVPTECMGDACAVCAEPKWSAGVPTEFTKCLSGTRGLGRVDTPASILRKVLMNVWIERSHETARGRRA